MGTFPKGTPCPSSGPAPLFCRRDLEHPVDAEVAFLAPLETVRPHPFEPLSHVLHRLDRLGPDAAVSLGVVGFEVDDLQVPAGPDSFPDQNELIGIGEFFIGLFVLKTGEELDDAPIHADMRLPDLFLEDDPLEAGAPAQGDIDLAVGEGAAADIDDDLVERLPLALVDGDGPGELDRILGK